MASSSLFISTPLRKIIPEATEHSAVPELLAHTIAAKEHDIAHLLVTFEKSLYILESSLVAVRDVIAILEELGGISVQAKSFCQMDVGYAGNKRRLGDMAAHFQAALAKLDSFVTKFSCEGINLLMGDSLTTSFDMEHQQKLSTNGIVLTSQNLGFRNPDFTTLVVS